MNKTLLVFCLLAFTVLSHTFSENTKVRQDLFLEKSTSGWKDEISQSGPVFVLLYQTWCGHCKNFIPIFDESATANETDVTFAAVDCSVGKQFCQDMNVKGYPTIYFIKDIDNFYKYQQARKQEAVLHFLNGGYEKVSPENFETFKVAKKIEAEKQAEALNKFKEEIPHLSKDTFPQVLTESAKGKFILFYAPWCGHCKKFIPAFTSLYSKQEGKDYEFYAMDATGANSSTGKKFNLKGYPHLVYIRDGKWYKFAGQRTEKAVEDFCQKGYLKQEADGSIEDVLNASVTADIKGGMEGAKTEIKQTKVRNIKQEKQDKQKAEAEFQATLEMPWGYEKITKLFNIYFNKSSKLVQQKTGLDAFKAEIVIYASIVLFILVLKRILFGGSKKQTKKVNNQETPTPSDKKNK